MTRKYELLYVLNGTLPADELKAQMKRVQAIVEASAEIADVTEWGRRRLAYEIQDLREGYYVIVHFNAQPDAPKEIERLLRIADYVLRYLIVVAEGSYMPVARRSLDDEREEAEKALEVEAETAPEVEAEEEAPAEAPVAESQEDSPAVDPEPSPEEAEASPEMPERTE
ncbi:MAG TPA: 30S ribosomal protein S6 [Clostridia bacterium]|nr:30S ribosomal protein S6 [Clostridia bacterium]